MKDAFMMSREEMLAKTRTDSEKGLTPEQVEKSRSTYGTNSFVRQNHESLAKRIWDASTEPMLVMLIFAAIITYFNRAYRDTSMTILTIVFYHIYNWS